MITILENKMRIIKNRKDYVGYVQKREGITFWWNGDPFNEKKEKMKGMKISEVDNEYRKLTSEKVKIYKNAMWIGNDKDNSKNRFIVISEIDRTLKNEPELLEYLKERIKNGF